LRSAAPSSPASAARAVTRACWSTPSPSTWPSTGDRPRTPRDAAVATTERLGGRRAMPNDMTSGATLKDVAERAGVHPGTASRALNPLTQGLVSEATVRRVQAAAKALAYRPNPIARGLKTNRTMTVGIVVP